MPSLTQSHAALRSFLYGGGAILLSFDLFFLLKALLTDNFIPIVPIIAGIFTAGGLLFVVYAEHQARERDKREHRRISRVAHQLESPLQGLELDLEQLMADAHKLPAESRLKLKHMETKTQVLLENIRDIFLLLQAQQHPVSREERTYNVCTLVSEVIARHEKMAAARNVELLHKLHCENAPVRLDRRLFEIVLGHLIENAITYTLTPGLVNVVVIKGKRRVRLIVQDRGIGLNASDQLRLFRPFVRGKRAAEFDPDGIGVGLALSRLLVREFGAVLRCRNRAASAGSEFEIIIPLVRSARFERAA